MTDIDILPRIPGYSNKMMHKQCMILASVVNAKKEIKVGRGKGVKIVEEYKHNTPK